MLFVALFRPTSIRLWQNMHVESVGAAFALMKKKHPPGELPFGNCICYSMLIGQYTHSCQNPKQRRSASWGRKRCVFA